MDGLSSRGVQARLRSCLSLCRVTSVLEKLGLQKVSQRRIGCGLSGGERKRLSVACQLLTDPPLLFLDEPTSGLDSASARSLVAMLSALAKAQGKTVLATLHQPSSHIFAQVHTLLLLAPARQAFFGTAQQAFHFFDRLGYHCPDTFNPADFYIRQLALIAGKNGQNETAIDDFCDQFVDSKEAKEDQMDIERIHLQGASGQFQKENFRELFVQRANWFVQVYWLLWRSVVHIMRNPSIHLVRTIQKLLIAVLLGVCYGGIEINQGGIRAVQGAIFIFVTENTFPSLYGMIQVIPQDMPVVLRDHRGGVYRVDAYYVAKAISVIPTFLFEPLVFICIAYWLIGLRNSLIAFVITSLACVMTANVASAAGTAFSTAFENVSVSLAYIIPFEYLLMLSAGLFINLRSLPDYIGWTKYFSWFMYASEAMAISQWNGVTNISCEYSDMNSACIQEGTDVLEAYSYVEDNLQLDFMLLLFLYFAFHLLGLVFLLIRCKLK